MKKLKLALEAPTQYLGEFSSYQDFHFTVAPWLREEAHMRYFRNSPLPLWLDNGFNELGEPIATEEILHLAKELTPAVVIPPDALNEAEKHLRYLRNWKGLFPALVGILRSDYRRHWEEIISHSDILAVPYGTEGSRKLPILKDIGKPVHLLGLRSVYELITLREQANSLDTGMPIKLALEGISIEKYVSRHKHRFHLRTGVEYISTSLDKEQLKLAHRNCLVLRHICDGYQIEEAVKKADEEAQQYS